MEKTKQFILKWKWKINQHKRGKPTLLFKSLGSEEKKWSLFYLPKLHLFIKNTGITAIILWHIITISNNFSMWILYNIIDCCCIFSIIFSVTWSSEIILICCSRNISDYYQYWKILQSIFLETMIHSNFQDSLLNIKETPCIWKINLL